ncbi:MAG: hypothetical protein ACLGG0_00320 [Bacteriovoracia bacterium]
MREKLALLIRSNWAPLFAIYLFAIFFATLNLPYATIDLYDETIYQVGAKFNLIQSWSPLYSLYYRLIGLFTEDQLTVQLAGHLSINYLLFPTAVYSLSMRFFAGRSIPFILTLYLLLTFLNVNEIPRVHSFNFSILTLSVLTLFDLKNRKKLIALSFLFGLFIHIRFENLAGGLLFLALVMFYLGDPKTKIGTIKVSMISIISVTFGYGLLFIFFSDWSFIAHDNRSFHAFQDYFTWEKSNAYTNIGEFNQQFNSSKDLVSFILNYPTTFIKHLLNNLLALPEAIFATLYPAKVSVLHTYSRRFVLIFFATLIFLPIKPRNDWSRHFIIAFSAQSILVSLITKPAIKYLLFPGFSWLLLILIGINKVRSKITYDLTRFRFIPITFVVLLAAFQSYEIKSQDRGLRKAIDSHINEWNKIDIQQEEVIFFPNSIPFFAGVNTQRSLVTQFDYRNELEQHFLDWIEKRKISLICYSDGFTWYNFIHKPADYDQFEEKHNELLYERINPEDQFIRCYRKIEL